MIKLGKYCDMTGRFKSQIIGLNENLWKKFFLTVAWPFHDYTIGMDVIWWKLPKPPQSETEYLGISGDFSPNCRYGMCSWTSAYRFWV